MFWVMMIFAGVSTGIMIIFLPETYAPIILLKKKENLVKQDPVGSKDLYAEHEKQDWSIMGVIHRTLFRPLDMLASEPILVMVTVYISIVYGLLYACTFFFSFAFLTFDNFLQYLKRSQSYLLTNAASQLLKADSCLLESELERRSAL